ncbi:MAG: hypothetical protein NTX24_00640 [Candidatus Pacearchaeota archaeon]|nr:hypothetical protein [Candidatus Pacearchaeota archaeon]
MTWRNELDKDIAQYIDGLIKRTEFFPAYKKAEKPLTAQLWTALGIMSKKVYEQELKIKLLEGVLMEISPRKTEKYVNQDEKRKATAEIERIMSEIAQRKPVTFSKPSSNVIITNVPRPPKRFARKKGAKRSTKNSDIEAIKSNIKRNF